MKNITVVAHAQYDFNDFCFTNKSHVECLQEKYAVTLEMLPHNTVIERLYAKSSIDVFVIDFHSWKCSEDVEALCRKNHPEARIVMIDSHQTDATEKLKYDFFYEVCPLAKPSPISCTLDILCNLELR